MYEYAILVNGHSFTMSMANREKALQNFEDFCRLASRGEGRESSIATHIKNITILVDRFGFPLKKGPQNVSVVPALLDLDRFDSRDFHGN